MKKIIKYAIIFLFAFGGAKGVLSHAEFSFYWWIGTINLIFWGGYLIDKLFNYLDN